jgi:nicotinamide mononucleotide adenylyltransferase
VRAVELATGKKVARVEIDQTGKIIVFPGSDDKSDTAANPWDADLCRESD